MIGQDFWTGEGTTAKSFAEDLKAAGDGIRKIHLRVNSPGGSVFDGLAIYNTLLSHGAKITASVDGLSASIASVITMAASEISMGDNAMMMIHNPSTVIGGDSNDMRKMADTMDKVKTSMITAYRRHSPKSSAEISTLMDDETWMTAEETVENGFAEKVTKPEGDEADLAANFAPILAKFRNVPQQIAARFTGATSHTKRVAGENLTSGCFIYVGDEEDTSTWHLPWHFAEEEKTKSHLRDALARFDQADIPASAKPAARAKLVRLCKEHGITVADSDKKAAKALKRLLAAAKAEGAPICMCDCFQCKSDACPDCSNSACEDQACTDCPAQGAKAAAAKAGAATPCVCACLPCSKENNCQDCANANCDDENCEDCPQQSAAKALARSRKLRASKCVCACLPCSKENNCEDCVNADCTDSECDDCPMQAKAVQAADKEKEARWMQRLGGEFEESATLYASAAQTLTQQALTAHELLRSGVLPRLDAAEKLLSGLKTERAGADQAAGKVFERVSGELRAAAALPTALVAEIARQSAADSDGIAPLEAADQLLGRMLADRAADLTALASWTERVHGELERAATAQQGALDLIAHLPNAAAAPKIEAAETLLASLVAERTEELTALAKFTERLSTELETGARLEAAMTDALTRPQAGLTDKIVATETILLDLKSERAGEANALARISADLDAACQAPLQDSPKLLAAVREELSRRIRLAAQSEAGAHGFAEKIDAAQKVLSELSAERTAATEKLARLRTDLQQLGQLRASVAGELGRRARLIEPSAPGALNEAASLLAAAKTERAAEVTAHTELLTQLTTQLKAAAELQAGPRREMERRHRLAESAETPAGEIAATQKMLTTLKSQRIAAGQTIAELVPRITGALDNSTRLQLAAAEDLERRARLASASGEVEEIVMTEGLVRELKAAVAAELKSQAACAQTADDLKKAGALYRSAVEELGRRGRLLTL